MSAKAMIRTALAIDGLRGDARAAFDLAASERYHGIAFATNHAELTPDELDQSGRRHLKKILAAKHLAIDAIRAAAPRAGLADPATIDRTIENARKAILLAHDLGVETVALHLGNLADARTPIDTLVAAIRELSQHADAANMTLAFSSDVAGPLAKILKQVDYERARVNLDTARLIGAGEDPLILAEELAGSIGQVTAADAVRGGGGGGGSERGGTSSVHATFLGEGQLPLTEFMEILQEQGFAGPLVVDVRDLPESEEGARHAAEVLRKLMRELPLVEPV